MNPKDAINYIVNEMAPQYTCLNNKERTLIHATLQSLPTEVLATVAAILSKEERTSWDMLSFIEWWQKKMGANVPIETLLSWFQNKDSKKVRYAYEFLTRRYDTECYANQKDILRAFLCGGKTSSEWAARRLYKQWFPGLEEEAIAAWEAHKGQAMAKTIIHYLPEEFSLQEDEDRLGVIDWFNLVGRLVLVDRIPAMDEKANQYIRELNWHNYLVGYEENAGRSLYVTIGMNTILWAMKRVGNTSGLIRLARLEQYANSIASSSRDGKYKVAASVFSLKYLVDEDMGNKDIITLATNAWLAQEMLLIW